jgi:sterol desaturase/sphingolipid hydroxylase (fatty acid hydroxylase superfamily)
MRFWSTNMTTFKTLTIVAALLAGGTSLAMAQNGLPTGGESPVAGGAGGGGWGGGWYYGRAPIYGYGYRPYRHLYAYAPRYRHYRSWHY